MNGPELRTGHADMRPGITAVGTHTELLAENPHYRYVIASLDQEPRDLDSELSELEEAADAEAKETIR